MIKPQRFMCLLKWSYFWSFDFSGRPPHPSLTSVVLSLPSTPLSLTSSSCQALGCFPGHEHVRYGSMRRIYSRKRDLGISEYVLLLQWYFKPNSTKCKFHCIRYAKRCKLKCTVVLYCAMFVLQQRQFMGRSDRNWFDSQHTVPGGFSLCLYTLGNDIELNSLEFADNGENSRRALTGDIRVCLVLGYFQITYKLETFNYDTIL